MKPILIAAVTIVNLALVFYTIGIVKEQRCRRVTPGVLAFLTAAVLFDIAATTCMILGSRRLITPHGFLGYSALLAMLADTVMLWRHHRRCGSGTVPPGLHLYSRFAYIWWLVAYLTGAVMVAMSR